MNKIKSISLLLTFVMLLGAVAACGPADDPGGTTVAPTDGTAPQPTGEAKTYATAEDGKQRQILGRLLGIDGNDAWILLDNSIVDGKVRKFDDVVIVSFDELPRDTFYHEDLLIYGVYLFDLKSTMERGGRGNPSTADAIAVERVNRQEVQLQQVVKLDINLGMKIKQQFPELPLVDVREETEYADGHLPGADQVSVSGLSGKIGMAAPLTEVPVMVYCRSGRRSETAAFQMQHLGYRLIIDLGGIQDYNGEVETGMPEK